MAMPTGKIHTLGSLSASFCVVLSSSLGSTTLAARQFLEYSKIVL